ncbi:MAG TPA: GDSL-type esterase/lipase family protein, partial [Labilithrix sp.]
LLAYSGKGIAKNEDGSTTDVFGDLYARTLPDSSLAWSFASFTPDVVVISLGGADLGDTIVLPAGFNSAYGALVDTIRGHYPAAHIFCTVWSQIKSYNNARQTMSAALQSVISARASDTKLYYFEFPEANHDTDETGCEYHANEAHHQAMATLLAAQIKTKTGW